MTFKSSGRSRSRGRSKNKDESRDSSANPGSSKDGKRSNSKLRLGWPKKDKDSKDKKYPPNSSKSGNIEKKEEKEQLGFFERTFSFRKTGGSSKDKSQSRKSSRTPSVSSAVETTQVTETNLDDVADQTPNINKEHRRKGVFSSIRKKFTSKKSTKNNDTETFLDELSAQFDNELNLLDDIDLSALDDKANDSNKYGTKWSYLSNENESKDQTDSTMINNNVISKDETPPFPVSPGKQSPENDFLFNSVAQNSTGIGNQQRDRQLDWEKGRRERRRNRKNHEQLANKYSDEVNTPGYRHSYCENNKASNRENYLNSINSMQENKYEDGPIYDVPKVPISTTTSRLAQYRQEALRALSSPNEPEMDGYTSLRTRRRPMRHSKSSDGFSKSKNRLSSYELSNEAISENRSKNNSSPTEQTNFFDKAKVSVCLYLL